MDSDVKEFPEGNSFVIQIGLYRQRLLEDRLS